MTDQGAGATTTMQELAHTMMSEAEALTFLAGQRISLGGRTMDPKAQIVGEFVRPIGSALHQCVRRTSPDSHLLS